MTRATVIDWVQRLGLPTALLLILASWMATSVADPVIASHREFLAAQVEATKTSAQTLERLAQVMDRQAQALGRIEEVQRQHTELLSHLVRRIDDRGPYAPLPSR